MSFKHFKNRLTAVNTDVSLYTVPSGKEFVLMKMRVRNVDGASSTNTMTFKTVEGGQTNTIGEISIQSDEISKHGASIKRLMEAGSIIKARASVSGMMAEAMGVEFNAGVWSTIHEWGGSSSSEQASSSSEQGGEEQNALIVTGNSPYNGTYTLAQGCVGGNVNYPIYECGDYIICSCNSGNQYWGLLNASSKEGIITNGIDEIGIEMASYFTTGNHGTDPTTLTWTKSPQSMPEGDVITVSWASGGGASSSSEQQSSSSEQQGGVGDGTLSHNGTNYPLYLMSSYWYYEDAESDFSEVNNSYYKCYATEQGLTNPNNVSSGNYVVVIVSSGTEDYAIYGQNETQVAIKNTGEYDEIEGGYTNGWSVTLGGGQASSSSEQGGGSESLIVSNADISGYNGTYTYDSTTDSYVSSSGYIIQYNDGYWLFKAPGWDEYNEWYRISDSNHDVSNITGTHTWSLNMNPPKTITTTISIGSGSDGNSSGSGEESVIDGPYSVWVSNFGTGNYVKTSDTCNSHYVYHCSDNGHYLFVTYGEGTYQWAMNSSKMETVPGDMPIYLYVWSSNSYADAASVPGSPVGIYSNPQTGNSTTVQLND